MTQPPARNRFLPLLIGGAVVAVADIAAGYGFMLRGCAAPTHSQFLVLFVMPAVYLTLMYLAFRSQP